MQRVCLVTVDPMFRAYVLGDRLCSSYSNYPPTTFSTVFPFLTEMLQQLVKAERHPGILRTTASKLRAYQARRK